MYMYGNIFNIPTKMITYGNNMTIYVHYVLYIGIYLFGIIDYMDSYYYYISKITAKC